MAKDIMDAVYGSLIASAVGDALGAPVEMMYWSDIRAKYGRVTELMPGRGNTGPIYGGTTGYRYREQYDGPEPVIGWFSDDTTMRHYLCLAIIEKGGRVTPPEYRDTLVRVMNPSRVWAGDRITYHRLRLGMNPWDAGTGAIPAGIATMMMSPIGIINAGNPRQAFQDAFNIGFVSQEGANRDGAATFAAGVAAAMVPGATYDRVLDTMLEHSTELFRRAIGMTMDLAAASSSIDDFAGQYYSKMLDWSWPTPVGTTFNPQRFTSGSTVELVPITMALIHLCKGDLHQSMIECASFGRDCDTTASMAGAICGAMEGASALRADWIETVEGANLSFYEETEGDPSRNIRSVAERLVRALRQERDRTASQLATLEAILG
jgi:ADP-ribosylglycohydrolase